MKRRIFILLFLLFFVFSSCVYASDTTQEKAEKLLSDLSLSEENCVVDQPVTGNVFSTAKEFEMLDTASIAGNLYVGANKVTLKSVVNYSNDTSGNEEPISVSVNSKAKVKGNTFIVCKEFIMEQGCEISGDLYIVANTINIQQSATIGGNLFVVSMDCTLNGRVQKSIYATCKSFKMDYYGSVANDLHLASREATLNSIVHRNAYIDSETINTSHDFMTYGDLKAETIVFNFSGEVEGDTTIKAKTLNFINSNGNDTVKCFIKGDLNYSTPSKLEIADSIVNGETTYSIYQEEKQAKPVFSIKDFIIKLITFVLYVFIIVWLFVLFAKDYSNMDRPITVKNVFSALGIGLLSILCVIILSILLLITSIGSRLALVLIVAYILVLLLATPLFVLDIARALRGKLNFFVLTLLLALGVFIISQLPYIGGLFLFLFKVTGTGRLIRYIISKKSMLHYKEKEKNKTKQSK